MSMIDYLNPYAYVMRLRRALYERRILKSSHPGIPVISIGNLSLGGTGKSPLVEKIANYLYHTKGDRVAVLSRGYRRRSKGYVLIRDGGEILANVEDSGDESQMLAEVLPHAIIMVDEDRVHGAYQAKSLGADVILLDDGYQHLRIERDLNILLVDSAQQFTNVIPFGKLREPLSAARAADVIIITNAGRGDGGENSRSLPNFKIPLPDPPPAGGGRNLQILPLSPSRGRGWVRGTVEFDRERIYRHAKPDTVRASMRAVSRKLEPIGNGRPLTLNDLQGKRIFAVSSIASPRRFHEMLEGLGAEVIDCNLGDHAEYNEAVVADLLRRAEKAKADILMTTAKDAVKSRRYFEQKELPLCVYVLQQDLEFLRGERSLYEGIDRIL